jgi:phenylacetate-CoA ligase
MTFINFLNERIVVPLADMYMGTEVIEYLRMIQIMSTWTHEQIRDWQNEQLKKLIAHACKTTRYYNELLHHRGLTLSDIKSINDLKKLPVLTKEYIVNNSEKFIPKNLSGIQYKKVGTGGSTGDPLHYLQDKRSFSYATALRYYFLNKLGYRLGDKLLVLGGSSVLPNHTYSLQYKIYHFLNRKTMLSSIDMSDQVIDQYLEVIRDRQIAFIFGSPSVIYLLACRLEKRKEALASVKGYVSTSEMLLDHYREKIESVLNCTIMDVYGAGDGGISAYESEPGIYQVGYNCIVEIENSEAGNDMGNIIATDLLNYAFPFIRYQIGDQISLLDPEKTKIQYNGQIITQIWGRKSEIMRLENGITLTGKGWPTLFSHLHVRAFRIKKTGYLQIECEIEKAPGYTKDEEYPIRATFKKHAGEDCVVSISYVDNFQPLRNGKRNFFISSAE